MKTKFDSFNESVDIKSPGDYYFNVTKEDNFFDKGEDLITVFLADKTAYDKGEWIKLTNRNLSKNILRSLYKAGVDTSDIGDNLFDFHSQTVKTVIKGISNLREEGFIYKEDLDPKFTPKKIIVSHPFK